MIHTVKRILRQPVRDNIGQHRFIHLLIFLGIILVLFPDFNLSARSGQARGDSLRNRAGSSCSCQEIQKLADEEFRLQNKQIALYNEAEAGGKTRANPTNLFSGTLAVKQIKTKNTLRRHRSRKACFNRSGSYPVGRGKPEKHVLHLAACGRWT